MGKYSKSFTQTVKERQYRKFSDTFKKQKVREIEQGKSTVSEVSRAYEVSSNAIYKWIRKYSTKSKPERTIVESKSETQKILALQKKVAELERKLGQKQIQLEFNDKMIEIAEKKFNISIKKNSNTKR
jgi:transposase-like protein